MHPIRTPSTFVILICLDSCYYFDREAHSTLSDSVFRCVKALLIPVLFALQNITLCTYILPTGSTSVSCE